jgi:peptide deformylase
MGYENLGFLRKKCEEVVDINEDTLKNLRRMLDFIYKNDGIGLAANQIKVFERLVVVDLQKSKKKNPIFMINPEIVEKSEELVDSHESCISIKNVSATLKRYKSIRVKYLDEKCAEHILDADGLLSFCLQHEIDLLDGITFLDRVENKNDDIQDILNKIDSGDSDTFRVLNIIDDLDILKQKSEPVKEINQELLDTMQRMLKTMYKEHGIGLAGVQVGILKRILVIDLQKDDKKDPLFVINPEIIAHSENMVDSNEGCLSVPCERSDIKRYETVTVNFINEKGEKVSLDATDLLAVCLQHEIDHLNGIVFVDHLSKLKREFLIKKIIKNRK